MDNVAIKKSIFRSQHCQRNWDLEKVIPQDDLDTLMIAATQCPSKQNIAFYKLHFITNRELIEKIHAHTSGFVLKRGPEFPIDINKHEETKVTTNPQVLANLLIVFEEYLDTSKSSDALRNTEVEYFAANVATHSVLRIIERDRMLAIGVAAGYLNLVASMLGYSTGCCTAFSPKAVSREMNIKGRAQLLMGIGYSDANRNRRIHHVEDIMLPTKKKQPIPVEWIV